MLQELVAEDCLGPLLMEPRKPLDRLLSPIPPPERNQAAVQALIRRLEPWRVAGSGSPASSSAVRGSLQVLSQREREVLARIVAGDRSKLIARSLDLSPHTVKRHVANILVKLEVSTRSAAAGVYRQYK